MLSTSFSNISQSITINAIPIIVVISMSSPISCRSPPPKDFPRPQPQLIMQVLLPLLPDPLLHQAFTDCCTASRRACHEMYRAFKPPFFF
jgi:hypothetical protein